jgi:hypothetical protein
VATTTRVVVVVVNMVNKDEVRFRIECKQIHSQQISQQQREKKKFCQVHDNNNKGPMA